MNNITYKQIVEAREYMDKIMPCGTPDDSTCRESGIKLPNSESTLELKQQISELRNAMGELSMRINENYSKMREFEKQIVQPMRDHIHVLEKRLEAEKKIITDLMNRDIEHSHRLSALEQPEQYTNSELAERIEKLEQDRLVDIVGRIEYLESWRSDFLGYKQRQPTQQCNPVKLTCEHIEPKTTGMTFAEAIEAMKQFKKVRRASWKTKNVYYDHLEFSRSPALIGWEELISTDWEIVT